ncbi:MAG: hypothetical protein KME69_16960 [Candidatus Thiodiazotropha sp. (ex Codakia orbicularis)]|nr:hypothetical protein [Candidatus Thiodiazotropha sp. (ex Codakia orbicularis)]
MYHSTVRLILTIESYLILTTKLDLPSPKSINYIFLGLCMITATQSHAVKCIQSGYTEAEGAIKCYPYHMINTWDKAAVTGAIWTSFEPANKVFSAIPNPPYCGEISANGTEPVIRNWAISNFPDGPSPRAHRFNDVEHYDITYPQDPYIMPDDCHVWGTGHIRITDYEEAACDPGHEIHGYLSVGSGYDFQSPVCGDPLPAKECKKGNPIDIFTGNKLQYEQHISGYGSNGLSFNWYYNTQRKHINYYSGQSVTNQPLISSDKPVWMHGYEKRLYFFNGGIRPVIERVNPADSQSLYLVKMGENNWVDALNVVFPQMEERTEEPVERWKFTDSNGNSEFYDPEGRLVKQTDSQGRATLLSYVDNKLTQVSNWKGHTLDLTYDINGVLESVTDSTGHVYRYQFVSDGLLSSITFPDETPGDLTNNPVRSYRYEDSTIPHALTSILDEGGQIAASWTYNVEGRAISSSHAGGADTTTFSYGTESTTVINPLGKETTYHYSPLTNIWGVVFKNVNLIDRVEGHPSTHCVGDDTNYQYNWDGFVKKKTDRNGNITTYTRDDQGRELSRTEARYNSESRTISTTWDTSLNKPLTVTESDRVTEYLYDAEGRLLSKTERPR